MARKTTPDIMSSLMGSDYSQQEDYPQESNEAINTESNELVNTESNEAINNTHSLDIACTKATFSISNETLDTLEEAWFALRKKLRSKRITKTAIVEVALELALADYEQKGEKSKICKKLKTRKIIPTKY